MFAATTTLDKAQKVKQFLHKNNLQHPDFKIVRELGQIFFPMTKKAKVPGAKVVKPKFSFPKRENKKTIYELLGSKLTKKQLSLLPKAQELVGTILILEIPQALEKKEKIIAQAYLKFLPHCQTVVKKTYMHKGIFRTRKVKILAGVRTKKTIHHENSVKISLHLEKTYFSARSANERLRIAGLVKPGENVLVMFSGAGPFPLVIAKKSKAKTIVAIELNPLAHQFALDNIVLNKISNISLYHGDVAAILPKIKKKFSRIVMPLPKTGEDFLHLALGKGKSGAMIHLYAFLHENEIPAFAKKIKEISKGQVRIIRKVTCGQFSPGVFRMCFDLKKK